MQPAALPYLEGTVLGGHNSLTGIAQLKAVQADGVACKGHNSVGKKKHIQKGADPLVSLILVSVCHILQVRLAGTRHALPPAVRWQIEARYQTSN
jgi:hypothetical protein